MLRLLWMRPLAPWKGPGERAAQCGWVASSSCQQQRRPPGGLYALISIPVHGQRSHHALPYVFCPFSPFDAAGTSNPLLCNNHWQCLPAPLG